MSESITQGRADAGATEASGVTPSTGTRPTPVMCVSVQQADLKAALAVVNRVQKQRLPVLAGVRLATTGEGLALARTDLELELIRTVPARVDTPGACIAPAAALAQIVRELPRGAVTLESDGVALTVRCSIFTATLPCFRLDDFPAVPDGGETVAEVDAGWLRDVAAHVLPAAATDSTRPILTAVDLWIDGGAVASVAAADGFRLAAWDGFRTARLGPEARRFLLPARALRQAVKCLPRAGAVAIGAIGPERATLSWDGAQANLWLVEGQYPRLEEVIPRDPPVTVIADTAALLEACKALRPAAQEAGDAVRLGVAPGAPLRMWTLKEGVVTAEVAVDVQAAGEGDFVIGFHVDYLIDALAPVRATTVRIGLTKPAAPARIEAADPAEPYLAVVMPMHLRG
ncbi:MAG: DNA polymerase III subunit beta [Anaerolineae bacterium]|nr:DNA polymerase III subunit beta [Anaerolineae bacterium]